MKMTLRGVGILLGFGFMIFVAGGCATQDFVRQEIQSLSDATDKRITALENEMVDTRAEMVEVSDRLESETLQIKNLGPEKNIVATLAFSESVLFQFDRAQLTEEAKKKLDQVVERAQNMKPFLITLAGHADSTGVASYNMALGEKRAQSVYHYLVDKGVSMYSVSMISFGEDKPAFTEKTKAALAKNRRVELEVFSLAIQ